MKTSIAARAFVAALIGVAFAGGGVAGATGFVSSFVAFFSTPPWPLHAPSPA